mmetsp:Transcript_22225/g.40918  ORF Transcript_22225/g.40918 Transcript_22225/m.40918 type:complete len:224 (-) Transcript_22225:281-952(-)
MSGAPVAEEYGNKQGTDAKPAVKEENAPDAHENNHLTDDERWSIIWACVNIYYTWDASIGVAIAILAFTAGIIFKIAIAEDCDSNTWMISLILLVTRLLDACCGCAGLVRDPFPTRRAFFWDIIRNMFICMLQGILALVIIGVALHDHTQDSDCSISTLVAAVSGILLILQASEEFPIWCVVLFLWCIAGRAGAPKWVDGLLPQCLRNRVMKHRKDTQTLSQP